MADTVNVQTLHESATHLTVLCVNVSDGTGEANVAKVDVSGLSVGGTTTRVIVEKIQYCVYGAELILEWDATTDVPFAYLQGHGEIDATEYGGIRNNAGAGITGDILFTFTAARAGAGDGYTVLMKMRKN